MDKMTYLTTTQAAAELGVTRRRVTYLIATGRLRAERFGAAWLIAPAALDAVRVRTIGRPPTKLKSAKVDG